MLGELCALTRPPGALLEWDGDYPSDQVLADTLARIHQVVGFRSTVHSGAARRHRYAHHH